MSGWILFPVLIFLNVIILWIPIKWESLYVEQNNFWSRDESLNEESLFSFQISPCSLHPSGHCTSLLCGLPRLTLLLPCTHPLLWPLSHISSSITFSLVSHPHFPPLLPQEIITTRLVKMALYSNSWISTAPGLLTAPVRQHSGKNSEDRNKWVRHCRRGI